MPFRRSAARRTLHTIKTVVLLVNDVTPLQGCARHSSRRFPEPVPHYRAPVLSWQLVPAQACELRLRTTIFPTFVPYATKVCHTDQDLNVRNCRPASRSTSTRRRHARCPR